MSKWVTAMMIDDCIRDPVLGAEVILGFKDIPPPQALRLRGMWQSKFMIDSSGLGSGKSTCIAIVAALRMLLIEDRTAGIISYTFRQGKQIFENNFDRWIETSPIFRNEIRKNRVQEPMSTHGTDYWQLTARNGNVIRVVPPSFMTNSDRVAGESWTDGYFDEWTRYQNYDALDQVLVPRVRKPISEMYDVKDPIFTHHIYFGGTAGFQWNPCYTRLLHFMDQIALGNRKYEVQSWHCEHYPERSRRLTNPDVIEFMKSTMRPDQIQMEVYGRWVKDSVGFYSAREVSEIRKADIPVLTMENVA
jgi:hypothetical protein